MNRGAWDLWRTLPRVWPYLRPYKALWITSFLITTAAAALALAQPWPLAIIVDNVLSDHPVEGPVTWLIGPQPGQYAVLAVAIVAGFAITVLTQAMTVVSVWISAKLEQRMVLDLRSDMFAHAQGLSLTFHDARLTGQLMNQINNQASAMGAIVVAFAPILQALMTLIGMLVVITLISWKIALVALIAVPFIWYSLGLYGTRIVPRLQRVQAMEWRSLSIVHEAMSMLGVTSATAIGTSLVLGFGAWSVLRGDISVGQMLVLIAYIAAVYQPLEEISNSIGDLNDHFVQFNSSLALLDLEKEVQDAPDAISLDRARGYVAFEHVDFNYRARENALTDVTFAAEPGQR